MKPVEKKKIKLFYREIGLFILYILSTFKNATILIFTFFRNEKYLDKEQRVDICQVTVSLCFGIKYPHVYSYCKGKSLRYETEDLILRALCKHLNSFDQRYWIVRRSAFKKNNE